jgi:hypothetical protein
LKAGFGQLESWAGGLRRRAVRTSRLRATGTPALRAETLEPRQMLAATVLNFGAALPEHLNDAPDTIEIEFSQAVLGFDTSDLLLTVNDGTGTRQIEDLSALSLSTSDGGTNWQLENLSSLTAAEGDYQLTVDVFDAGIVDVANRDPLSTVGFGLGAETVTNGSFDTAGGGSNDLTGWTAQFGGAVWKQESPGDGAARVISDTTIPDGAAGARIKQELTLQANTTYQLEFDFTTTDVGQGTSVWLRLIDGSGGRLLSKNIDAGDVGHLEYELVTQDNPTVNVWFFSPTSPSLQARDFTFDNLSVRQIVLGPTVEWTMDTTAPTATISSILPIEDPVSPRNSAVSGMTITFDEPVMGLTLDDMTLKRGGTNVNLPVEAQLTSGDGITWTLSGIAASTGPDGNYVLTLLDTAETGIRDLATNLIGQGDSESWLMETVAPVVGVVAQTTDNVSPRLTGSVDDPLASVSVRVVGHNFPAADFSAINHGDGTWTLPAGTIEPTLSLDGTYDVRATATDVAGNAGTDATTGELTLDRVPVVTVDPLVTNDTTPALSGTVDDPAATVEVRVDGVTYTGVINNGDGTWTLPDNTISTPLAETLFDVQATATDTGGKVGVDNTLRELTVGPAVIISEFMADNNNTIEDFQGDASDWIELRNIGSALDSAVDVQGWFLTDNANNLTKWEVPVATPLGANQQVLVFASGKDLVSPAGELHTNFQIGDGGEYLALVKPDGVTIAAEFADAPNQREDVSYGRNGFDQRWFPEPTPGTLNNAGVFGFTDVTIDQESGLFDDPIEVTISTASTPATPGAVIRYTTDGSAPTSDHGTDYTAPLTFDATTLLRAVALLEDHEPTKIETRSYIFFDSVLTQDGAGFPTTWAGTATNYSVSSSIVNHPAYRDTIRDDLRSIPTISLVMDPDDLFGPQNGIYSHPLSRVDQDPKWEVPVSAEMIGTDGNVEFRVDAGVRIQGGASRNPSNSPKHSFRLIFKTQYGPGKLDYPLFGDDAPDKFNTFTLRAGFNDGWGRNGSSNATYLQDRWAAESQLAAGGLAPHGIYVHLYINGLYWGLYNPVERPDGAFAASYLGGEKEDYYAYVTGSNISDDPAAGAASWNEMFNLVRQGNIDYAAVQEILDVPQFIDYMIVNLFGGNRDWPHNNWYATRGAEPGGKWRFHSWDAEFSLQDVNTNHICCYRATASGELLQRLSSVSNGVPEFRQAFADAIHRHLFNGGLLTPQANIDRVNDIASRYERAIVGESARWGRGSTLETWRNRIDVLVRPVTGYFDRRTDIVIGQFRSAGLYPRTAAPSFHQHGGQIDVSGFDLIITNENVGGAGDIYFTLDGSDPQLADGSVSPTALRYDGISVLLLQNTVVKARTLDSVGWSALNEASFVLPRALSLAITEIMYNPGDTTADEEAAGFTDSNAFEFIELQNTGNDTIDLAGVQLSDAVSFNFAGGRVTSLAPGERVLVVSDEEAFTVRYPNVAADTIAGEFSGRLKNSAEQVVLTDAFGRTVLDFEYKDGWYNITDGQGFSLSILDAQAHPSTWTERSSWRPSSELGGSPGAEDPHTVPDPGSIVINEVLTHTDTASGDLIELLNTTKQPIDISGWYLSDSGDNRRKFRIPDGTILLGEALVTFDQFGLGGPVAGFGDDPVNNPGAFGLSELGDSLRISSVDPNLIRENVDAAHVMSDGSIVLSTGGAAMLGAPALAFGNGDLIRYNPATDEATLLLAESQFDGGREDIDAVSILDNGNIVLSTDGPARLGGLDFGNGDLIEFNPTTGVATLLFSETLFVGGNENIDAVHVRANGSLIISTRGPAALVGDVTQTLFDDGDLIEIIPGVGANLAGGQLGAGAIVRRYLAESVFAIGAVAGDPTENIDAVSLVPSGGQDAVVLSTASGAAFKDLGAAFQNGDLVQITNGGNELGSGTIAAGAQLQLLIEEDPVVGRTFYGDVGGYREKATFGASQSEVTFGRYIKSTGGEDFVAMSRATPGAMNSAPKVGPVVINEIMYNPAEGESEYIELLNVSNQTVKLFGDPSDPTSNSQNTWRFTAGVQFALPAGSEIPAGGMLIVLPSAPSEFIGEADPFAAFTAAFRNQHAVPAQVAIIGPYGGALNNGGEDVELSRPGKTELDGTVPLILVDRVNYDNSLPWPVEPAGNGPSLSRFDSISYGNDVANWLPSAEPGGTPGAINTTIDVSPPSVPGDLNLAVMTTQRIDVSWTASFDRHSLVTGYRVYRNNALLVETQALSFSDTTAAPGEFYAYEVSTVNSQGLESERSLPAQVAILAVRSTDVPLNTEVTVVFSERVDEALAERIDNYTLVGPTGVTIFAAVRDIDGRTVRLTTSKLQDEATYQLTVTDVVALSGSQLPLTPGTFEVVVPDVTLPTIHDVLVGSSLWSQDFRDLVVTARGLGDGAISIPTGADQLTPLSWSGLDTVSVRFSEPVTVRQDDLTVTGVNRAEYGFADFRYDAASNTATWTLDVGIGTDKLLLDLSDAVHDGNNNPIDGNWTTSSSAFPSGNGVLESNDDFRFRIDVAVADGNGDGVLSRDDLIDVIHSLGVGLTESQYNPRLDANADGQIDVVDLRSVVQRLSSRLPSAEPTIATAQPAVVAVDTVFSRQGAGGSPAALHADPLPARHPDIGDVMTVDRSGDESMRDRLKTRSLLRTSRGASRRIRTAAPQLAPALVDRAIEAEPAEPIRRSRVSRRR